MSLRLFLVSLFLVTSVIGYGQRHDWVDSNKDKYHRPTKIEYSSKRATQGHTALNVSGVIKQLGGKVNLDNNTLEIKLAKPLAVGSYFNGKITK